MKPIFVILLLALSSCLVSCGFWNLDPADKLDKLIGREARKLKESQNTMVSFEFVPDAKRARTSPRFTGDVVIRVKPDQMPNPSGGSTIFCPNGFGRTIIVGLFGSLKS